jgi:hypothetical protein
LTASDAEALMTETTDALVLDLVEWIAREPRLYSEVIETWRTSCPRLTIWEDAVDRGYIVRETVAGAGVRVAVTEGGATFLRAHGRIGRRGLWIFDLTRFLDANRSPPRIKSGAGFRWKTL